MLANTRNQLSSAASEYCPNCLPRPVCIMQACSGSKACSNTWALTPLQRMTQQTIPEPPAAGRRHVLQHERDAYNINQGCGSCHAEIGSCWLLSALTPLGAEDTPAGGGACCEQQLVHSSERTRGEKDTAQGKGAVCSLSRGRQRS